MYSISLLSKNESCGSLEAHHRLSIKKDMSPGAPLPQSPVINLIALRNL
jgi:hypothetical protein